MFHLVSWVCFILLTFVRMAIYGGSLMVVGTGPVRGVGGVRGVLETDITTYMHKSVKLGQTTHTKHHYRPSGEHIALQIIGIQQQGHEIQHIMRGCGVLQGNTLLKSPTNYQPELNHTLKTTQTVNMGHSYWL